VIIEYLTDLIQSAGSILLYDFSLTIPMIDDMPSEMVSLDFSPFYTFSPSNTLFSII
jgi:hypothetical protein